MVRRSPSICLAIFVGALSVGSADARNRPLPDSNSLTPIVEASPTLAPFQHVRFCLRYPSDCKTNPTENAKRHELLENGLPSKALRLSVVKTASGIGHLVLVVVTTKGDIVMDNLTEVIRPWQTTDYHWLKIQSPTDSKFWYEIKAPAVGPTVSQADPKVRLAGR